MPSCQSGQRQAPHNTRDAVDPYRERSTRRREGALYSRLRLGMVQRSNGRNGPKGIARHRVTAPAEGQKRNGARLACVPRPSDVSRLDHPQTMPQMQINASTPKTIISSRSVGLEAASISASNSAHV